jgi:hypothetical protein
VGADCGGDAKGDWSGYSGIRVRIRGDLTPLSFDLYEKVIGSQDAGEIWRTSLTVMDEWADIDVPFASMRKRDDYQPPRQDNNGILNLERLLNLMFEVAGKKGSYEVSGIWLLKPRFSFVARLRANRPPGAPTQPAGPTATALLGRCRYVLSAEDRDGDSLSMRVDWGDGSYAVTGNVPSGRPGYATHAWTSLGTYQVRAQAVDSRGSVSAWSAPLTVMVGGTGPFVIDEYETTRGWEAYSSGPIALSTTDTGEGAALRVCLGDAGMNGYWVVVHRAEEFDGALSGFRGLSFRVRSEKPMELGVQLQEVGVAGGEGESWEQPFKAGPEWSGVTVKFSEMKKSAYQVAGQDNNGRLDLDVIGQLRIFGPPSMPEGATIYVGPVSLLQVAAPPPTRMVSAGVVRASMDAGTGSVILVFSGHLDKGSACDPANYHLEPASRVVAASLWQDGVTVELTTEGPLDPGTGYRLSVAGVSDCAGNPAGGQGPVALGLAGDGLLVECWPTTDFAGEAFRGTDRAISIVRDFGEAYPGISISRMSTRWNGWLKAEEGGEYAFILRDDDGGRLSIDGRTIIDDWKDAGNSRRMARVRFEAGSWHRIGAEHYNAGGNGAMDLRWCHGGNPPATISPLNLYTKRPAAQKPAARKPASRKPGK